MENSKQEQHPEVANQHLADRIAGKVDEKGNPIEQSEKQEEAPAVETLSGNEFLAENDLDVKDEETSQSGSAETNTTSENPAETTGQAEQPGDQTPVEENKLEPENTVPQ